MKTHVLILGSMALAFPALANPLPAGMARADNPKAVAALHSEANQKRVETIEKKAPEKERLTAAEEYTLKLIAYRTQLVEAQHQRKIKEIELQIERESRLLAEERAAELERERRRESIYIQHHTVHAYQRNLNDEYWREQRLRKLLQQQQCNQAPPQPCPQPSPQAAAEVTSEDPA